MTDPTPEQLGEKPSGKWTQAEALALCVKLEAIAPKFGCHVALTGGCLYGGSMKDCDVILYRIRQAPAIDFTGFFMACFHIGVIQQSGFGFCFKAGYDGKRIDFLCPEEEGDEYPEDAVLADAADKLTTDNLLK